MTNLTQREAGLLAQTWGALCAGNTRIVRVRSDDEQLHLECVRSEGPQLPPRELNVLLPILLGKAQKVVAAEVSRSGSSVAWTATSALRRIGFDCRPNDAPIIAVMMARAAVDLNAFDTQGKRMPSGFSASAFTVSVSRLDGWLATLLTPAELKVLRLRIDGHPHDRVARMCGVAKRTVANQIASAYRKLGVSARLELLNKVLDGALSELRVTPPFETYPTLTRASRAYALAPGGSPYQAANEAGQMMA